MKVSVNTDFYALKKKRTSFPDRITCESKLWFFKIKNYEKKYPSQIKESEEHEEAVEQERDTVRRGNEKKQDGLEADSGWMEREG